MDTTKAKVLVIGGGGREHALAWKLAQSEQVGQVFVAPGNGGTGADFTNVDIGFTDVEKLLAFAQENQIDLTVIGQEAASDAGVVDAFQAAGLRIFGSTQAATQIESSKAFSKQLMQQQHIPTAAFQTFTEPSAALAYLEGKNLPIVIKASGLAEGKGVIIASTLEEAQQAVEDMMVNKIFKAAGDKIVIEDFLAGQEVSAHALCDGSNAVLFPTSQDHKQVFDNDKGPNTGGMGAYAPVPWVTPLHMQTVQQKIVEPALVGIKALAEPFIGCLYPGLMIDGDEINVIEFNARFGDPEVECYLRLLDGDLYQILLDCSMGKLQPDQINWQRKTAVTVAVASGGYPGSYEKGLPISGLDKAAAEPDIEIFHAGTKQADDGFITNGGRVLYVTATGDDIQDARKKAYAAIEHIQFDGMHYRKDIGLRQAGA